MATGRIGVTPTLGLRWSKAPAGGTTSLSGLDDNSVSLVYSVGYEQVYRNGVLLSRTNDYTATSGTSITLIDATIAGDIIEVFANELVPLTDAISKGQFTAKGTLLSASAASTPAVLGVGSNDQVLTADSTTTTGLKWATPAAGGMTLLSTTTLSGASTTVSSINQTYVNLYIEWYGMTNNTSDAGFSISTNLTSALSWERILDGYAIDGNYLQTSISAINNRAEAIKRTGGNNYHTMLINNYASSTHYKTFSIFGCYEGSTNNGRVLLFTGGAASTTAIDSFTVALNGGQTMTAGTIKIYGVK